MEVLHFTISCMALCEGEPDLMIDSSVKTPVAIRMAMSTPVVINCILHNIQPPKSWTVWLCENILNESLIDSLPLQFFMQPDQDFRWTILHGLFGSGIPKTLCKRILKSLQKKRLHFPSMVTQYDSDGDTPLTSAIRSRSSPELIKVLLKNAKSQRHRLLQTKNQSHHCALQIAFDMQEWDNVELLLRECINCNVHPELTGISISNQEVQHGNTLLHKAMKRRDYAVKYLEIHLDVSKADARSLSSVDKKGLTPFHYLTNFSDTQIVKEVVQVLIDYKIDLNDICTSESTHSYLFHDVYRKYPRSMQRKELIDLLLKGKADPDRLDGHNLKPHQRERQVEVVSPQSSPQLPFKESSPSTESAFEHQHMDGQISPEFPLTTGVLKQVPAQAEQNCLQKPELSMTECFSLPQATSGEYEEAHEEQTFLPTQISPHGGEYPQATEVLYHIELALTKAQQTLPGSTEPSTECFNLPQADYEATHKRQVISPTQALHHRWLISVVPRPYLAVYRDHNRIFVNEGWSPQRSPSPRCEPTDWPGGVPGSGLHQESLTTPG